MADDIYSALFSGAGCLGPVLWEHTNALWTGVETPAGFGMCMAVPEGKSREIACLNAFYNRGDAFFEPYENHYTAGIDFRGKKVGVVGHLGELIRRHRAEASEMYVFELAPKDELDLPAELEDELLPKCDIAVITGSALVNGTLPHLLDLCQNAYTVLTGPSVPQCPALLNFGIDRLAGLCVADTAAAKEYILNSVPGNPYRLGKPFLITR